MLVYITQSSLSSCATSLLSSLPAGTPVLLVQNGVYLFDELRASFPDVDLRVLIDDAVSRGVPKDKDASWTLSDWSCHPSGPWIPLK